jgi:RNA polymerase sigma-70 factor (ECF subfamily)
MRENSLITDRIAVHESDAGNLAAAWESLRPELLRLVRALGVGSANADDILQEVYLTAREKGPRACDVEDLRRWLIRVTVNRCRLEHRRTGCWRRMFRGLTKLVDRRGRTASAADTLCRDEEREQIRQALQSLDHDMRSLLVQRYFTELNSTEIGQIFDLPEATVRGRLRMARQKLAQRLRQMGYKHD